jgi:hypothetical protein
MTLTFKRATKSSARLRAALFGPSGAGKTFTALRIAAGLGGAIAVIDTERGSASKYADRFGFDVLDLEHAAVASYEGAIAAAARARYPVLVVDSLSHGWQELLQEVDRLAAAKYRGNPRIAVAADGSRRGVGPGGAHRRGGASPGRAPDRPRGQGRRLGPGRGVLPGALQRPAPRICPRQARRRQGRGPTQEERTAGRLRPADPNPDQGARAPWGRGAPLIARSHHS